MRGGNESKLVPEYSQSPPRRRPRFLPASADRWIGIAIVLVLAVLTVLYATGVWQGGL
jgi:hypothetical protein